MEHFQGTCVARSYGICLLFCQHVSLSFSDVAGVLALVFNNLQGGARTPLSIALSGDSGSTWPYVRDLDTTPGGDFSYPSIIEGADGLIHVTYTYNRESIKYIRVSSEWVKHGGSIGQFGSSMNDERN